MKNFPAVLFILLLLFSSCNRHDSEVQPLPEHKVVNFYADLLILQNEDTPLKPDTLAFNRRIDSLYRSYGFDTASVNTTIRYYNGDISRWKTLYEKVMKRIEAIALEDTTRRK